METTLELKQAMGLKPDQIKKIEVEVNAFFPTVVQHPEPRNEIEAQFSLPHALSLAILEEEITPRGFSRSSIDDERFRRFRTKVKMIVREDWGWTPTGWTPRITYTLADGQVIVREPTTAKGQPPALLDFNGCIPKYRSCIDELLPAERVERSIEMLRNLRNLKDVNLLVAEVATNYQS